MSETTQSEFVRCPCCLTEYSSVDEPDAFERVSTFNPAKYAARVLGERNAGHKKHLSPEQREARRVQLAINRSKGKVKL